MNALAAGQELPRRIAQFYGIPLQVSSFFALLILSECITAQTTFATMGIVDARILAHRLRRALQDTEIEVRSRYNVGYWLDADTRRILALKFGIDLGIST